MNFILLQVILAFTHFILTLVCAIAPLKIIRGGHSKSVESKSQRIISWCNCISGGVFISTLFVGLLPFVRSKFNSTIARVSNIKINYPIAEVTLVLGFFMILLIEQCAVSLQSKTKKKTVDKKVISIPNDYHLTDISSGTDSDDELSASEDQCLTSSSKNSKEFSAAFNNHVTNTDDASVKIVSKPQKASHNHEEQFHDHSHGHGHSHMGDIFSENITLRSILLFLALSIHSVFEGLAMGLQKDVPKLLNLFAAVLVHECMVSFAIGVNLYKNTMKTANVIKLLVVFCLTIPVGMMIGLGIGSVDSFGADIISGIIQGLAAGTFLYVVFQEIIPEEFKHPYDRWLKSLFLFIGFVVIACLRVTLINQED